MKRTLVALTLLGGMTCTVAAIALGNEEHALGWLGVLVVAFVLFLVAARNPQIKGILGLALLLRLSAIVANEYFTSVPLMGGDANRFHRTAMDWALQGGPTLGGVLRTSGSRFYVALISIIYTHIGISRMLMEMLNVLVGCLVVLEVYKLSSTLWNDSAGRRAALAAALFPTLVLYSAAMLREAFFAFPFILGIRYLVLWTASRRFSHIVICFVALAVAASFHPAAIPVLGVATTMAVLDTGSGRERGSRGRVALRWAVAVLIAVFSLGALIASGWGTEKLNSEEGLTVDVISNSQESASRDRAGYLRNLQTSSPALVVIEAPIRIAYFLFTPFPWQVSQAEDVVGLLDALLYLAMAITCIRRRASIKASRGGKAALLGVSAAIFVLGLFTSNYGTALRHRAKTAPVLICLASVTFMPRDGDRRKRRSYALMGPGTYDTSPISTGSSLVTESSK